MEELDEMTKESVGIIREKTGVSGPIKRGVVLGTVMQRVMQEPVLLGSVSLREILPFDFPANSAAGHQTVLELRRVGPEIIAVCRGRVHLYETLNQRKATFLIRILRTLGLDELLLTQAAGALNKDFHKYDVVFLNGVFNWNQPDPLLGVWPRPGEGLFMDPCGAFDSDFSAALMTIAKKNNIRHQVGMVSIITGPLFEEEGLRLLLPSFADVAGMSTGNEAIVAKHAKIKRVAGIAVLTDECKPGEPIEHESIITIAKETQPLMDKILNDYYNNPLPLPIETTEQ